MFQLITYWEERIIQIDVKKRQPHLGETVSFLFTAENSAESYISFNNSLISLRQ